MVFNIQVNEDIFSWLQPFGMFLLFFLVGALWHVSPNLRAIKTSLQKALENSKGRKLSKIRCKMKNLAKSGTALKISLMCSA